MAFDEKKFVGADALSELSTKVKTELDKKTDKAGALTNVSYDTTNKKLTKTTQGAHDPVTTDIVTTATLKTDMGIADFDGTFSSLKSKPTTISGYGITDAKVQNSTVTIGSNSVTALTQDDVSSTYDSSGTSPVDGKAVAAALGTLDVESVGGAGKYISAISETDGKISATAETMDSTPTSSSTKAVTSDGIYEYVNSSVATNTAYFIGTFDSVEELEAYSGIITNNDYAFVTSTDSSGNTLYNRYKYNGSTHTWSFEYALNNSSFTSAQWATIQSGLTSSDKTKLDGIQSGANKTIVDAAMSFSSTNPVQNKVVNTALAGKQDTLTFDSTPTQSSTNPVTSAGIYTDQARQDTLEAKDRAALIEVENKGAKNLCPKDSETSTAPAAFTDDFSVNLPAGTYVVSMICNVQQQFSLSFYRALPHSGNNIKNLVFDAVEPETRQIKTVTLSEDAKFCAFYYNAAGESLTDIMICTKAEWDISHQYEPYARTNRELTVLTDEDRDALVELVDNGAKNELSYNENIISPITGTNTVNGFTATKVTNGGINIKKTGTPSNSTAYFTLKTVVGKSGRILVCGGQIDNVYIYSRNGSSVEWRSMANAAIEIPANDVGQTFDMALMLNNINGALNNITELTIYPMICTKAEWDISHQYEPYARTNRELTVLTDEDRAELVEIVDGGAKNVRNITLDELKTLGGNTEFAWSGNVATKNNVSFTINTDGTITVNASQAASAQVILDIYRMPSDASDMVLSGAPAGGDANSYFQYVKGTTFRDYGEGVMYSKTGAHNIGLVIAQGYRPQNLTFKTMICTTTAWKISKTYQPYRPSWQEITDNNKIIDITSQITAESGYTVESSTHLYYQNKQVFGTIAIAINSNSYPSSLTAIAKLPVEYAPARQYLGSCGFSTDQWAITNIGYAFIQTANASSTAQRGQISVKSPTPDLTHMILNVCYPTVT